MVFFLSRHIIPRCSDLRETNRENPIALLPRKAIQIGDSAFDSTPTELNQFLIFSQGSSFLATLG
jgi:hypothetical protein